MPKVTRSRKESDTISKQYAQAGWKQAGWRKVHSSAASSFYTSTIPLQIMNSMMEANKQKRVLSTGTVIVTPSSRPNGKIPAIADSSKGPQ